MKEKHVYTIAQLEAMTWHRDPDDPTMEYAWTVPDDVDPFDERRDQQGRLLVRLDDHSCFKRRRGDDGSAHYSFWYATDLQEWEFPAELKESSRIEVFVHMLGHCFRHWNDEIDEESLGEPDWFPDAEKSIYPVSIVVDDDLVHDRWLWRSWTTRWYVIDSDEFGNERVYSGPYDTHDEAEAALLDGSCEGPSFETLATLLGVRQDDLEVIVGIASGGDTPDGIWKLGDRLFLADEDVWHPDVERVFTLPYDDLTPPLLKALLLRGHRTGNAQWEIPWSCSRDYKSAFQQRLNREYEQRDALCSAELTEAP